MIGPEAVVTRNMPDQALVIGVPVKQVRWICSCGTTLQLKNDSAHCDYCKKEYRLAKGRLKETRKSSNVMKSF
jgi:UDP-2-acetamido-3-amino-2,3-dideoxy-glucuronate N-acetyltransferase